MFKLLIECSKDIESLRIDFTEGNTVVKTVKKESVEPPPHINDKPLLGVDDVYTVPQQQHTITLPDTSYETGRKIKIDENLQNLDI